MTDKDINKRFADRLKINQAILAKIAKIDEFKGLWQGGLGLSPQILGRLKKWVIITSTGASTRIEGATMTDKEIDRFLRGLKIHPPSNRDEEEVAGYADLIGRVFDNWKEIKLSESWILQFHKILLQFSTKDKGHIGQYKAIDNTVVMTTQQGEQVVLFKPTPPYLVKPEMDVAISWANQQLDDQDSHPLLVIANFIFEFLAIHPFTDGNGRLSRALTNLLLLKSGYNYVPYVSLDEIIEDTRSEYYLALRSTQKKHKTKNEDITPWVEYFLEALLQQIEKAQKIMNEDQPEKLLSANQANVLQLFDSGDELSVADVYEAMKKTIPRATIKQVLSRLVELNMLERIGQGRGTRYKRQ